MTERQNHRWRCRRRFCFFCIVFVYDRDWISKKRIAVLASIILFSICMYFRLKWRFFDHFLAIFIIRKWLALSIDFRVVVLEHNNYELATKLLGVLMKSHEIFEVQHELVDYLSLKKEIERLFKFFFFQLNWVNRRIIGIVSSNVSGAMCAQIWNRRAFYM